MNARPHSALTAWRHWLALWLGWLAMGQLGSVMTWSWFSGLGGVVAWWCWLQWAPLRWHPRHVASRWTWLLLALAGMAAVMLAGRHQLLGWLGWALAVVGWAQTVLGMRQCPASGRPTPSQRAWLHWLLAPLLAFTVAAVAADPTDWSHLWPLCAVLLLVVAWPSREQTHMAHADMQPARRAQAPAISQAASLLMMGSLPLMSAWCLASGQSVVTGTGVHLWVMAWASHFTQGLLTHSPHLPLRTRYGLANLLLMNAALVAWLGSALWHMALVMALLAAATTVWQFQSLGDDTNYAPAAVIPGGLGQCAAPLALLWLGHTAPTQGPQALTWALAALAVLALFNRQASPWPAGTRRRDTLARSASLHPPSSVTP